MKIKKAGILRIPADMMLRISIITYMRAMTSGPEDTTATKKTCQKQDEYTNFYAHYS